MVKEKTRNYDMGEQTPLRDYIDLKEFNDSGFDNLESYEDNYNDIFDEDDIGEEDDYDGYVIED